jgi:hypothetical protein
VSRRACTHTRYPHRSYCFEGLHVTLFEDNTTDYPHALFYISGPVVQGFSRSLKSTGLLSPPSGLKNVDDSDGFGAQQYIPHENLEHSLHVSSGLLTLIARIISRTHPTIPSNVLWQLSHSILYLLT